MRLILNKPYFEYDIRGLLISFHPWEKFDIDENSEDPDFLRVDYEDLETGETKARIAYRDGAFFEETETVFRLEDPKKSKRSFMKVVYGIFKNCYGKDLPWGTLSGIRPTKISMKMLNENKSEKEIHDYMENELLCSKEKTDLSIEISKRENRILKKVDPANGYSLYVGIPFCPTTCLYCSFTSYPIAAKRKLVPAYLEALKKELLWTSENFKDKKLQSIYFGGGTPTSLEASELQVLFQTIIGHFDLSNLSEWTVEAGRPDSITREKLEAMKKFPIDRISINPQTMNQKTLDLIGRHHTVEDVKEKYQTAREIGFQNINMDLILGLPGETFEDIAHTMDEIISLNPENVTLHSLALKRASRLNQEKDLFRNSKLENPDQVMDYCRLRLSEIACSPYYLYRQKNMTGNLENTGCAKEGNEGIYNILIMEEVESIVACGAGATTKRVQEDLITRAENVKDVELYIREIDEMLSRKERLFKDGT